MDKVRMKQWRMSSDDVRDALPEVMRSTPFHLVSANVPCSPHQLNEAGAATGRLTRTYNLFHVCRLSCVGWGLPLRDSIVPDLSLNFAKY